MLIPLPDLLEGLREDLDEAERQSSVLDSLPPDSPVYRTRYLRLDALLDQIRAGAEEGLARARADEETPGDEQ
jgi:hypothetical protein